MLFWKMSYINGWSQLTKKLIDYYWFWWLNYGQNHLQQQLLLWLKCKDDQCRDQLCSSYDQVFQEWDHHQNTRMTRVQCSARQGWRQPKCLWYRHKPSQLRLFKFGPFVSSNFRWKLLESDLNLWDSTRPVPETLGWMGYFLILPITIPTLRWREKKIF